MFTKIKSYVEKLDLSSISDSRKELLDPLAAYLNYKVAESQEIHLNFICTHNSRRSHMGQVWAQVMAAYFDIPEVQTYSGGTMSTAVFPKVIETFKQQELAIELVDDTENPVYSVAYGQDDAMYLFSKKYDDSSNPDDNFIAIMTCSEADQGCPLILGAEKRFAITYEDPKVSDGTTHQDATYLTRSIQVATEMKYVFSKIKK